MSRIHDIAAYAVQLRDADVRLISGDQSIVWDAGLKVRLLLEMGFRVSHDVHTADLFSRGPQELLGLSNESYGLDQQVRRWTATMESAPFLGRMPIQAGVYTEQGIALDRLIRLRGDTKAQAVHWLTSGDWTGVHLLAKDGTELIAHGVPVSAILTHYAAIRRSMRHDAMAIAGMERPKLFDTLWGLGEHPNSNWGVAGERIFKKYLERVRVDTRGLHLCTSVDMSQPGNSPSLRLFIAHYDKCRMIYNEAIADGGDYMAPLGVGDLPYYAVVRRADGTFTRQNLTLDMMHESQGRDDIIAILGKAVPLILDMRLMGPLVLPEKGSAYMPKAHRFVQTMSNHFGLKPHPLVRIHFNALDALQDVDCEIRLPDYLHEWFGGERVAARHVGQSWRDVCAAAQQEIANWRGHDHSKFMTLLRERGLLSEGIVNISELVSHYQDACLGPFEAAIREAQAAPSAERKERIAAATALGQRRNQEYDAEFLKALRRQLEDMIEARRTERLRNCLGVIHSLPYWNARPFTWWVDAVPGWYEAIRARTELIVETGEE